MADTPPVRLILDSGAYAALTRGVEIRLDDYIAYIMANQKLIHAYVNLDVIPDRRHTIQTSAAASYENLERMWAAGLKPLPVFHFGEEFTWLERLIADGERYIGIGGIANAAASVRRLWLDRVFTAVTDDQGRPLIKMHGFGVTSVDILKRYPWYSVDSTSWAIIPAFGEILVPSFRDGTPDFIAPHSKVRIGNGENANTRIASARYERFGTQARQAVDLWLKEIGVTAAQLHDSDYRRRSVLLFTEGLRRQLRGVRFRHRVPTFCDNIKLPKLKPLPPRDLTIAYAGLERMPTQTAILNEIKAHDRLMSYFYISKREDALKEFVWQKGVWGVGA